MSTPRIAVLVSGGGRSLENLSECVRSGRLDAQLAVVVSDRPGTVAFERAHRLQLPTLLVDRSDFDSATTFSAAVFEHLEAEDVRLACLAGFLRLLKIPPAWHGRVINIHPSLLPDFGGKGFYGDRVHQAVIEAGVPESGCTVHFVDDVFDHGAPILQRRVSVHPGDTPADLAARVFEEEKLALPEAIRLVLTGAALPNSPAGD